MRSEHTQINERTASPGCRYQFGRFQFEIAENGQTLFSDGHAITLSTIESTILRVLIERNGEFVRTEDLLRSISPSPMASENLVHGAVRGLRRTLNDADLIKNERFKGYAFQGGVQRMDRLSNTVLNESIQVDSGQPAIVKAARKRTDPFVGIALLVTAPVVLLPFGLVLFGGNWQSLSGQLGFMQALMILVAIGYDFYFADGRDSRTADPEARRALIAEHQLRRSWRLLLASWCCLYITLPFSQWLTTPASGQPLPSQWLALQVIATFLNNSSALMLVLCYVVLNRPTVIKVADREVDDVPLKFGLLLVGAVALIESILVALSGRFGFPDYAGDVLFGFDLFSGVAGGIAMALFISRLDSRLLGASGLLPIIPVVLYLYVVIQPFYPLVNRTFPNRSGLSQHFDLWIMQLAFLLKSVMYIYVTRLFKSERFLFYMIHARRVYEGVEAEWTDFKSGRSS